jgi:hypothetical protein
MFAHYKERVQHSPIMYLHKLSYKTPNIYTTYLFLTSVWFMMLALLPAGSPKLDRPRKEPDEGRCQADGKSDTNSFHAGSNISSDLHHMANDAQGDS